MKIKDKEVSIEEIINDLDLENNFHKHRGGDIYLSNYQIDILKRNSFDVDKYNSLNSLIFDIESYLDENVDVDEELDNLLNDLSEMNYYMNTKK